jgi:integrase
MRAGECDKLEWDDIDFERCLIRITPEKNSNARIKKVSRDLIGRLKTLPRIGKRIFGVHRYNSMRTNYCTNERSLLRN